MAQSDEMDLRKPGQKLNPYGSYKKSSGGLAPVPKSKPKRVPRSYLPIIPAQPAADAGQKKKSVKIVQASSDGKTNLKGNWVGAAPEKKPMTLQEAARRNQTDEFIKAKMRPKKSLFGN